MKTETIIATVLLTIFPVISSATDCAAIKQRYWECVRSSMKGGGCSENISIPSECLNSGNAIPESKSDSNSSYSAPTDSNTADFFSFGKKERSSYSADNMKTPKKPVVAINLKALNTKTYLETEDDVEFFMSKLKDKMSQALKDGKRIHLEYR